MNWSLSEPNEALEKIKQKHETSSEEIYSAIHSIACVNDFIKESNSFWENCWW